MKKVLANLVFLTTCYLLLATNSFAQYGTTTYNYSILIDKTVAIPNSSNTNSNNYVDNLSPSDPRFHAGDDVWFKVRVKNTSDQNLTAVTVKDTVPTYILPIEGPGSWDLDNRIISWNAGDFNVDEEKTYYLKMRVYDKSMLPSDKGLFCVTNSADARNNVAADDDSTQICIEKEVSGVAKVPSAGPEMGLLLLVGEFVALTGGLGLLVKNKMVKYHK